MHRLGKTLGWSSRLCTDAHLLFHVMPQKFRFRFVKDHLGPAPGWFVRGKVVGKFPLNPRLQHPVCHNRRRQGASQDRRERSKRFGVDRRSAISATGYQTSISRMGFLDKALRRQIDQVEDPPVLSSHFETSVPSLYMAGLASANSFGPLARFAFGAKFTAKHSRHVVAKIRASAASRARGRSVGYATD